MRPDPLLGTVIDTVAGEDGQGLAGLSDDQLIGVIAAARRLESRAAWYLMSAVAEFTARNTSEDCADEFAAGQLACELHLTGASAAAQMDYAATVAGRHPPPPGTGTPAAAPGPDPPPGTSPGPPGTGPPDPRDWAARLGVQLTPIARGSCSHDRAEPGYRPSRKLQHLVKARNARCTAPGCGRPAARCDLDHTTAWDHGGITCECDLAPLCRHHHRCKQAEGWSLDQPEPGILVWRTPAGRTYATTPTAYPV